MNVVEMWDYRSNIELSDLGNSLFIVDKSKLEEKITAIWVLSKRKNALRLDNVRYKSRNHWIYDNQNWNLLISRRKMFPFVLG